MEEIYVSQSADDTRRLGEELAKKLQAGDVVALYGDLGSGKTTFTQGLAAGLGIKKRIISPTFVIVRSYKLKRYSSSKRSASRSSRQARTIKNFYHIDLYRIDSEREIEGLGLEEIINDPGNIVVIEWAEKMGDMLPKRRIDIYFEYINEQKRKITIKKSS